MASKGLGYVIGGLEIVVGAVLTAVGLGAIGIPLIIAGAGTIAGTAMTPTPPRNRSLRDSPNYGVDQFDNPRGVDAIVPIVLGTAKVRPPVIAEAVYAVSENNSPGIDAQRKQGVRALYAASEGIVAAIRDVEINDRAALSPVKTTSLGKGNGSKKVFGFPERWVWFGTDELPEVDVRVAGVLKSWSRKSQTTEFQSATKVVYKSTVGDLTLATAEWYEVLLKRTNKQERILEDSIRVYVRGPGFPEAEQQRRAGTYRFGVQKRRPWKVKLRMRLWPPAGYTVRVTYDYLGTENLWIQRDVKGRCEVVFGSAVANNATVEATYRVAHFPGLRIQTRLGTLDQSPMEGFSDLLQSYNPKGDRALAKNAPVKYSTDGREVDDLRIGILAAAFVQFKDDGGTGPVSAKLRVEYRVLGTTTWTRLKGIGGEEFKVTAERPGRVVWEIGIGEELRKLFEAGDSGAGDLWDAFERNAYEVQVTRLDTPSTDFLVQDAIEFAYVTEVIREGFVYPGTALLGIDVQPSEGLSGTSPRVTCIVEKGNTLFDPRTNNAHYGRRDLKSSQNAALALRYILTSDEGLATERFGGGHFFSGADFFLGEDDRTTGTPPNQQPKTDGGGFLAWADFCDEWVHRPGDDASKPAYTGAFSSAPPYSSGNGERRVRLNLVLDTPQALMEAVSDIAFLGYCFFVLQGARARFPLDQDGPSVFDFVDDVAPATQNAWDVHLEMDKLSGVPSHVVAQFWNEENGFERDELAYPVDPFPDSLPQNPREVNLAGCTRQSEALRMARHLAAQASGEPFALAWKAHPGAQQPEAGDIVTVRTRVPYSTGNSAMELKVRILSAHVTQEESGRLEVRYSGRVIGGKAYALKPASLPKTGTPGGTFGSPPQAGSGSGVVGNSEGSFTGTGQLGGGFGAGAGVSGGVAVAAGSGGSLQARIAAAGVTARLRR